MGHPLKDWCTLITLVIITIVLLVVLAVVLPKYGGVHPCTNSAEQIWTRMQVVERSKAYDRLKYIAEGYGARVNGYPAIASLIDWLVIEMGRDNLTATKQEVPVTKWTRGNEYAFLTTQVGRRPLRVEGLVGTVAANLTADIVVVTSFADLTPIVEDKIVLFSAPWDNAELALSFVANGAIEASRAGAKAILIRSPTPFSLGTMHTGDVDYLQTVVPIPAAMITVEDADTINGLWERKRQISLELWLDGHTNETVISHNVFAEIEGDSKKEEVVVVGAHIDTLELGQGVQDSLAGFIMAWESVRMIKFHQMKPARTIRLVGWVGSELDHSGAEAYARDHAAETVFAFESNQGGSKIHGLIATAYDDDGYDILEDLGEVMEFEEADHLVKTGNQEHTNLTPLIAHGVPVASFETEEGEEEFYWYRHSEADAIDTVTAAELRENGGVVAAYTFCVANLEENVPKRT